MENNTNKVTVNIAIAATHTDEGLEYMISEEFKQKSYFVNLTGDSFEEVGYKALINIASVLAASESLKLQTNPEDVFQNVNSMLSRIIQFHSNKITES